MRLAKVRVTARAVHDVKPWRCFEQSKIVFRQFVKMGDEPSLIEYPALEHQRQRSDSTAVRHGSADGSP